MLRQRMLRAAGAFGGFSVFAATSNIADTGPSTITVPSGVLAGDLIVFSDYSRGTSTVIAAPTGFSIVVATQSSPSSNRRHVTSCKIADGTEGGTVVTGMSTSSFANALVVFRGPGFTYVALELLWNSQITDSNPASQTVTPPADGYVVVMAAAGTEDALASALPFTTQAPEFEGTISAFDALIDTAITVGYQAYDSTAVTQTVDTGDNGGGNTLQSGYLSLYTTPAPDLELVGTYVQGFSGTTSDIVVSLTSLSGGVGTAPAAGDIVVVYWGVGSASTAAGAPTITGYQEISSLTSTDTQSTRLLVAYKVMGATPDTSLTVVGGTTNTNWGGAVAVHVWRNAWLGQFDVTATTATGTNSVLCDPPSITPITSGAVVISGGAGAHTRGSQTYSSSDLSNFVSTTGNNEEDIVIGVGSADWASGAFNPAQFTFSGSNSSEYSWAAVSVVLRPL